MGRRGLDGADRRHDHLPAQHLGNRRQERGRSACSARSSKRDGTAWTAQTSGTTAYLRGIWGSAANNLYAIGELGVILRYDGTAWSPVSTGTTLGLNGIGGSSGSDIWVVGNNGAILRYDGTAFSSRSSGSLGGQNGVGAAIPITSGWSVMPAKF